MKQSYLYEKLDKITLQIHSVKELGNEWRKEMFYLTMQSTHFNYGYMASAIWYSERRNLHLVLHGPLFPISSKGSFICTIPDSIVLSMTFVMEHWLYWEIAQWVHHEGSIWWPITPWINTTMELHLTPELSNECILLMQSVSIQYTNAVISQISYWDVDVIIVL